MKRFAVPAAAAVLAVAVVAPGWADTVRVTPLGSHAGEFCKFDRAMLFEDPDGTRILYDVGRTVRGPGDERLGRVDAVLLSHVHGDHLGDSIPAEANGGTCADPDHSVKVTPTSNTVNIVVGKQAKLLVGAEMHSFFGKKVAGAGGEAGQVQLVRYGGERSVGGVKVTTVPAVHSNGLNPAFLEGEMAAHLAEAGLTAYLGPPSGYVLTFSNGLAVYLSGDTGITAEQDVVVRQAYGAKLAVMNIGGIFTTGPGEAAWVINELVKPASVIASHANEEATRDSALLPGTKTETFRDAVNAAVHLPLSGRTMAFDGAGTCVDGC